MLRDFKLGTVVVVIALLSACSDQPGEPLTPGSPAFTKGGAAACPTPADFVVSDEAGLLSALSAASPGDVIGIDGFFEVTADVFIFTDDLTITCATPGSGLFAGPAVFDILNPVARRVTVERLVLDAGAAIGGPYFTFNDGVTFFAEDVRFTHNTAICGGRCTLLIGTSGAVIAENVFESAGSSTGVHLQGQGPFLPDGSRPRPIDGSRVERNTIIATAPSTNPNFGGIRLRDGRDVVVDHNEVLGPWANSVATAELQASTFESNRFAGAASYGIGISFGSLTLVPASDQVFRNNNVTAAGSAGIFVRQACSNLFQGNNLQSNVDDLGAVFDVNTGANTLIGNKNVVIDNGNFDCDGDGIPDPNVITGTGKVASGQHSGPTAADPLEDAKGVEIQ